MIFARPKPQGVDYSKCDQTVTVYHKEGEKITRTVYAKRAFLDFRKTKNVEKTGSKESNSFLLVIPGAEVQLFPLDKVILGTGPEITTREAWEKFIPAQVPGLVVVKYVDPKRLDGQQVHVEAGG